MCHTAHWHCRTASFSLQDCACLPFRTIRLYWGIRHSSLVGPQRGRPRAVCPAPTSSSTAPGPGKVSVAWEDTEFRRTEVARGSDHKAPEAGMGDYFARLEDEAAEEDAHD